VPAGLEGDSVERRLAVRVAEGDVVEADRAGQAAGRAGAGRVATSIGRVEDLEDAAGAGEALLHGVGDRGEVGDLGGELLQEAGEDDEAAAQRDASVDVEPAAVGEEDDEARLGEDLGQRGEEREIPEDAALLAGDLGVGSSKRRTCAGSAAKPLTVCIPRTLSLKRSTMRSESSRLRGMGAQAGGVDVGEDGERDGDARGRRASGPRGSGP
jgi:hypothetical protein